MEIDVSEARSGLDSRASTSREVCDDRAEEEEEDGLDPETCEVYELCGNAASDDGQAFVFAETQA